MTDTDVVLIHDPECPNVAEARSNLRRALDATGRPPRWRECDRNAADTPAEWRAYGSPTILVNGQDVADLEAGAGGNSCRVYRARDGRLSGVPGVEQIASVLQRAAAPGWKCSLAALPAIAIALLPNVTCPACWPGYAALLSSLGVGFLPSARYLLPLTLVGVAIPIGVLTLGARRWRGLLPLVLGILGSILLVVGRFALDSNSLLFLGTMGLVAASLWNAWPRRKRSVGSCPACSLVQITKTQ
jgi:hypothetical protein